MWRWVFVLVFLVGSEAHAWGEKGHHVIAHIAWQHMSPAVRARVDALLQQDTSALTPTDFVGASSWADVYRDSDRNTEKTRYEQTRRWHYINLKLDRPDYKRACFGSPPLQPRQAASDGPAKACIADKVEQFAAELKAAKTDPHKRVRALQFLIHLVGDLHQPLHASDNADSGGNEIRVSAKGFKRGTLHGYWDNAVVAQLGRKPEAIARRLMSEMGAADAARWQKGNARTWAFESLDVARETVYGKLPNDRGGIHHLDEDYAAVGKKAAAQQLTKAGVRLAWLLEQALGAG